MSDLISRSEAVQRLIQETVDSKNNLIHINTVKRLLQDVDNSYDIDKVVEQLEEKIVITWKHDYDGGRKDAFNEAIGIVKQGFVGTETGIEAETIRDKAVKWNNNSSKRVPYEFIDYVEGKREICVSDNVCEWKVKSNYYVTECSHDTDVMYGLKQDFKFCPYCGKKIKVGE